MTRAVKCRVFALVSLCWFGSMSPAGGAEQPAFAWVDYFGAAAGDRSRNFEWNNYLAAHADEFIWARTLRGIGRTETGMPVAAATGKADAGNNTLARLARTAQDQIGRYELIVPVGGLRHAKRQKEVDDYFALVTGDGAEKWKQVVYRQAVRLARLPAAEKRIHWQIGNEANTRHWSANLRRWAARQDMPGARGTARRNDPFVIPLYAEYFFAPSVEALRQAGRDTFGAEDRMRILLTSVAHAYTEETLAWLEALLSYRIRGDYAPSLKGRRVLELIDIITIHYLVSRGDENWRDILDRLHAKWVGRGRIRGVWSTEELGKNFGRKGLGAATALKVAARYLSWWQERSMAPEQGRALFWGWRMGVRGTRGEDSLRALHEFLGDTPLATIERGIAGAPDTHDLEAYLFQSGRDPGKRVALIFPSRAGVSARIRRLTMKANAWTGPVKVSAELFASNGRMALPARAGTNGDEYRIELERAIKLSRRGVLALFLTRQRH